MKKPVSTFVPLLILWSLLVSLPQINIVKASETIYIRADGTVEGTDKIQRIGNVYTFVGDINGSIVVERDNITIDGNGYTLQAGTGTGIYLSGRENVMVLNTQIKTFVYGIRLNSSSNNNISGNNIVANHGDGIYLYSSSNNSVSGNRIANNGNGIVLGSFSNYNSISGNDIANNGFGIYLWDSSNNSISGNNVMANRYGGIRVRSSSNYNSVSGNNITNHSEGICILSSSNNSVSGNNLTNNDICITLSSYSNYNSISGNNITDNSVGIRLGYSSNNLFFHNYFINNTQQVSIPTSGYANFWDNGVEGNYWSDYEDRYPNATELDDSGILDTPYVIDADNQDRYPLIPYWFPPTILIVSPENKTYTVNTFSLTFDVSKSASWIGYSLDRQANVTINGNTTLSGLPDGSHSLTVYAKDTSGNTGTSETIYFTITKASEPFPITWIAVAISIIVIGGASLLVYFRKLKKTTRKAEIQFVRARARNFPFFVWKLGSKSEILFEKI